MDTLQNYMFLTLSVINSLRGANVCHVGSLPGITRTNQQVKLTSSITLFDSPGVIFPDKVDAPTSLTIISTCITNQQIRSPLEAVKVLYTCCDHQNLKDIFEIPSFENFECFIHNVAKRFGKLKKGGLPDLNSASKIILHYCASGKMRYYLEPPMVNQSLSAAIVSDFKPKFNLNPIFEEQVKIIQELTDEISYLKFDPTKAYCNLNPHCDIDVTNSWKNGHYEWLVFEIKMQKES
ncbi:hypothetical protein MXB_1874 [Myxobolus squamalis]|nr:hypothetical protein MXB_1874 [Myxobolus squamalis]